MGFSIEFAGVNHRFKAPPGDEDRIGNLPVFSNGKSVVSCWEFSDEEWAEISKTRKIFITQLCGATVFPTYVGSSETVREIVLNSGATFKRQEIS